MIASANFWNRALRRGLLLFLFLSAGNLFAQEGTKPKVQLNSGIVNYGYTDHPYSKLTGRKDLFDEGNNPPSFFANLGIQMINPFEDQEYVAGFTYGFEFLNFSTTSDDVYTGSGDAVGPSVTMNTQVWSFNLRLAFFDYYSSRFQPYLGVGWGWISGDLHSRDAGIDQRSTLLGPMTYQVYGANLNLSETKGLSLELRNVRSPNIQVSNDPFGQAGGEDLTLDFSGVMLNFTGLFRF